MSASEGEDDDGIVKSKQLKGCRNQNTHRNNPCVINFLAPPWGTCHANLEKYTNKWVIRQK